MTITLIVGSLVVGFVVGVLFGRKNAKRVETTVAEAKQILEKNGIKV